jgi:hypothetical protein
MRRKYLQKREYNNCVNSFSAQTILVDEKTKKDDKITDH